jgi:hypothetical protein
MPRATVVKRVTHDNALALDRAETERGECAKLDGKRIAISHGGDAFGPHKLKGAVDSLV